MSATWVVLDRLDSELCRQFWRYPKNMNQNCVESSSGTAKNLNQNCADSFGGAEKFEPKKCVDSLGVLSLYYERLNQNCVGSFGRIKNT